MLLIGLVGKEDNMAGTACPNCGREDTIVPIVYGITTPEMAVRAAKMEIRIGGYAVGVDKPNWACNNCGHEWR
jgi:predicted RNA-binding Zn-ribbon protein involved in translation (DUF1610 family)